VALFFLICHDKFTEAIEHALSVRIGQQQKDWSFQVGDDDDDDDDDDDIDDDDYAFFRLQVLVGQIRSSRRS